MGTSGVLPVAVGAIAMGEAEGTAVVVEALWVSAVKYELVTDDSIELLVVGTGVLPVSSCLTLTMVLESDKKSYTGFGKKLGVSGSLIAARKVSFNSFKNVGTGHFRGWLDGYRLIGVEGAKESSLCIVIAFGSNHSDAF